MAYHVYSGQVSGGVIVYEDSMYVYSGGVANLTTLELYGSMHVSNGGVASCTTVTSCGYLCVSSGGTANSTAMSGLIHISSGGVANSTTVDGGHISVCSGGTAGSTTVSSGGIVFNWGVMNDTVLADGTVQVLGTATRISIDSGDMTVDGVANSITIGSGGSIFVTGVANSTTINAGGSMRINDDGTGTAIRENGGCVDINEGALATFVPNSFSGLVLSGMESATLHSGTTANSTTVNDNGHLYISSGGVANNATVNEGFCSVYSGGTANRIIVNRWGNMTARGIVNSSIVNRDGTVRISSGGVANCTTVNLDGYLGVSLGGVANSTIVNSDGWMDVAYDCTANFTTLSGGGMEVDGIANATVVLSKGIMYVDGTANSVTVNRGGGMIVSGGGKVTGLLTIFDGADVSVYNGGIVDFDISTVAPGEVVRINDLSLIEGTPDYTITVSSGQTSGIYKLANGAFDFDKAITVNTAVGFTLGTLEPGGTLTDRDYTYSLVNTGGVLTLTVDDGTLISPSGDLNGDGRADIVMTITQAGHGAEGATGAWLIQNDQTAAWGDLSQRNAGWEVFGTGVTAAGKTTNDVYIRSTGNVVGAWTTGADGKVNGWTTVGSFDGNTQVLGLGDFNGDGQSDLLLRNVNGAVGCHLTDGTGWNYFQSLGDEWSVCAVGDLNGDGRDDVVLKHDAGFAGSWLTQADCTMAWADLDTLQAGFAIVGAGDFDGDGTDDVLLKNGTYYGAWIVHNGNAAGWFGLGDLGGVTIEQIADFDADGRDDLRIRTAAGDLGTQLVKGADNLQWRYYGSVGSEWSTSLAAI